MPQYSAKTALERTSQHRITAKNFFHQNETTYLFSILKSKITNFFGRSLPSQLKRRDRPGRAFRRRNFFQKCAPTNAHIPNAPRYISIN
jgi:hypothetical protein